MTVSMKLSEASPQLNPLHFLHIMHKPRCGLDSRKVCTANLRRNPRPLQLAMTSSHHIQLRIDITTITASVPPPERHPEELEAAFFGS